MGMFDEGRGDRFQLPHAARPGQVDNVDPMLEGVDLALLRLLVPVECAAREEKGYLEPPGRVDGVDRLNHALLPDGEHLPLRVPLRGELHLGEPSLREEEGDHLLGRSVQEGVVDDGLLQEQHLVLQVDLVDVGPAVVLLGDKAGENLIQRTVVAHLDGAGGLARKGDLRTELLREADFCPVKIG